MKLRYLLILPLLLTSAGGQTNTTTDIVVPQATSATAFAQRRITGSANVNKPLGFNGSGVYSALSTLAGMTLDTPTFTGPIAAGHIVRTTDTGTLVYYKPSSDTDDARGTALLTALAAAGSGDTLSMGAGTYNTGTAERTLTGLTFSGPGAVINVSATDDPNFTISGCKFYGVTVQETVSDNGYTIFSLAGDCEFHDCVLYGRTDIFNGPWTGTPTLKMWNCTLGGKFDLFSASAVPAGSTVWLYNCAIECDSQGHPDFTIANCLRPSAGTFHVIGGYFRAVNSTSNAGQNKAIVAAGTSVVNLYNVATAVTSGGYDLFQQDSGTLNVVGGKGSGTNGTYVTSGTITRVGDMYATKQAADADLTTYAGITPSANVQSLLGAANYAAMRTQLSLVPGTNVQAYDADLDTLAMFTIVGPDSPRQYGWPNTNANFLTDAAAVTAAQGGTGQSTYSNGQILIGNSSNSLTKAQITAGPGITITNGNGSITIAANGSAPRVTTITSSGTPAINTDNCDAVTITAQAAAITSMTSSLSGTPSDFQRLLIRIKDDGTARAIAWGASYVDSGSTLPVTTVASKVTTIGLIYDSVKAKWVCLAVDQEP